jgi:hypothetical protein
VEDDKIVEFPKTAEEREALAKARQAQERQKIVNLFVDAAGGDQALFHTPDGTAYADLIIEGCRQTWAVRSKQFRYAYIRFLQREFETLMAQSSLLALALRSGFNKSAINEEIDTFEMRAICSKTEREVYLRVAGHGGDLYIDLCDPDWHSVRVTAAGWQIVQSPPVRFRRAKRMEVLPFPQRGTPINALRQFLNIKSEDDFVLVIAFLLAALRHRGPYPILALQGEQGAAKSCFARVVRSLTDPSSVPLSSLPPSSRDLFIAANNSHVLCFENISKLSDSLSDNLCRLATGGGFRIRTLYQNTDETLFNATRPIILNGITNFISRGDLQDRAIVLPLTPLSSRVTDEELWVGFERQRPGIFGALLDLLVRGARMLPETKLADPPRMADFATWAVACGLETFEAAYAANRQNAIDVLLEHDPLARALLTMMVQQEELIGTASELLDVLGPSTKITNSKTLSDELKRLAPMLRTVGIDVTHRRTAARREIRIVRR